MFGSRGGIVGRSREFQSAHLPSHAVQSDRRLDLQQRNARAMQNEDTFQNPQLLEPHGTECMSERDRSSQREGTLQWQARAAQHAAGTQFTYFDFASHFSAPQAKCPPTPGCGPCNDKKNHKRHTYACDLARGRWKKMSGPRPNRRGLPLVRQERDAQKKQKQNKQAQFFRTAGGVQNNADGVVAQQQQVEQPPVVALGEPVATTQTSPQSQSFQTRDAVHNKSHGVAEQPVRQVAPYVPLAEPVDTTSTTAQDASYKDRTAYLDRMLDEPVDSSLSVTARLEARTAQLENLFVRQESLLRSVVELHTSGKPKGDRDGNTFHVNITNSSTGGMSGAISNSVMGSSPSVSAGVGGVGGVSSASAGGVSATLPGGVSANGGVSAETPPSGQIMPKHHRVGKPLFNDVTDSASVGGVAGLGAAGNGVTAIEVEGGDGISAMEVDNGVAVGLNGGVSGAVQAVQQANTRHQGQRKRRRHERAVEDVEPLAESDNEVQWEALDSDAEKEKEKSGEARDERLRRRQDLGIGEIMGDSTSRLDRFDPRRLKQVLTYTCKNLLKPRNIRCRAGENLPHDACTFPFPSCQYTPSPLPDGWKKGDKFPDYMLPTPEDYAFADAQVYMFDLVDTYGVTINCIHCAKERQELEAKCATHQLPCQPLKRDKDSTLETQRLAQLCWTHEAEPSQFREIFGTWIVASRTSLYNYATARARICRNCKKTQHDLMPEVWEQLPESVLADLPISLHGLDLSAPVMLHKRLEQQLMFHVANGGLFQKMATWMAEDFALQDDIHAAKYYADVLTWQSDVLATTGTPLPHAPYFNKTTLAEARSKPSQWGYDVLIKAFEKAVEPLLDLLEMAGLKTDSCSAENGSRPMVGFNCRRWLDNPPDPDDPDYWLYLCLDHNVRTARKCGAKFVWNVTNAKTKELMYQRFTNTTSRSDWSKHLAALAATPYCRGRVKIVFVDNLVPDKDSTDAIKADVKRCCGPQAECVQDIWHVINGITCRANNRVKPAYTRFCKEVARSFMDYDEASVDAHKRALLARECREGFYADPQTHNGSGHLNNTGYRRLKNISDEELALYLLRPPDFHRPPALRLPLRDWPLASLTPTWRFYKIFNESLTKSTVPFEMCCQRLDDCLEKFRNETCNGNNLYPNYEKMQRYFWNAKRRAEFIGDPPGCKMYVEVGVTSKGMPKQRSCRGTGSTEQYHNVSNCVVGSDTLRPPVARKILRLANTFWNCRQRRASRLICPQRAGPDMGHDFWWVSQKASCLAAQSLVNTVEPPNHTFVPDVLASMPHVEHVSLAALGVKIPTRDKNAACGGFVGRASSKAQRSVYLDVDGTKRLDVPLYGERSVGRPKGAGDGPHVKRPPRNPEKKQQWMEDQVFVGGQTVFTANDPIARANARQLQVVRAPQRVRGRGRGRGGTSAATQGRGGKKGGQQGKQNPTQKRR
mmetsp:Transcript_46321/g.94724  ORF Transcript_46321/g.94724 Transcript_46321/m.94724 type:complete len:1439 (-) Transcript_46321:927-5243(-)